MNVCENKNKYWDERKKGIMFHLKSSQAYFLHDARATRITSCANFAKCVTWLACSARAVTSVRVTVIKKKQIITRIWDVGQRVSFHWLQINFFSLWSCVNTTNKKLGYIIIQNKRLFLRQCDIYKKSVDSHKLKASLLTRYCWTCNFFNLATEKMPHY